MEYKKLIKRAIKTNKQRNKDEQEMGFQSANKTPADDQIRTAMCAIEAGIKTNDWNAIAEAQIFLNDSHKLLTGKNFLMDTGDIDKDIEE